MCGICGIYNFSSGAPVEMATLRAATQALVHRGPDDEGFYVDQTVGLGNRRLSIIDLAGGHQPISNEDATVWISFNGEIYNYRELRQGLMRSGHRLATTSDTETIVHLYEDHGPDCLQRLRGIFAFALWDKNRRRLLLARDRLGVKPFFYKLEADRILFASELRALRLLNTVPFETDVQATYDFFAFRYVPAPETLYQGVRKLLPGHYLEVGPEGAHTRKYWDVPEAEEETGSIPEFAEAALEKLRESVRLRLVSDVPLGVFLSGGTDSSAIVALMSELGHRPLRTYSVGFSDPSYDESPYAQRVAERYGTEHQVITVGPENLRQNLPRLVALRHEPIAEPTDIPLFLLAQLASEQVKVVLAGEGGDELFAGYPKYVAERWRGWSSIVPASLLRFVSCFLPYSQRRLKLALQALALTDNAERAVSWFSSFSLEERRSLFSKDFLKEVDPQHPARTVGKYLNRHAHWSPLKRLLYADLKVWLPDNLLLRGDHMTMAASLEERVPFLDHELVEQVWRIPSRLLISGFKPKALLKGAISSYLPRDLLHRPKVGFRVPVGPWFRNELKDLLTDLVSDSNSRMQGIFKQKTVETLVQEHLKGIRDHQKQLWALLNFVLWQKVQAGDSP